MLSQVAVDVSSRLDLYVIEIFCLSMLLISLLSKLLICRMETNSWSDGNILKWAEFWCRFRWVFLQNLVLGDEEEFCNAAVDEVVRLQERNTAICGDWRTELISRRNVNIKMDRLSMWFPWLVKIFLFQEQTDSKQVVLARTDSLIPIVIPLPQITTKHSSRLHMPPVPVFSVVPTFFVATMLFH